ncbi:hypothetical protein MANES_06G017766v8 [Manihot esculenta]|uniref:Uncharacterized protein n=1 Tax=Manihot esculenta TaxID=3983 RepID=A0ACB7HIX3_MANES|nr:hypothetical protein MANES_06G017766v8 [Manihot esculenta]
MFSHDFMVLMQKKLSFEKKRPRREEPRFSRRTWDSLGGTLGCRRWWSCGDSLGRRRWLTGHL